MLGVPVNVKLGMVSSLSAQYPCRHLQPASATIMLQPRLLFLPPYTYTIPCGLAKRAYSNLEQSSEGLGFDPQRSG